MPAVSKSQFRFFQANRKALEAKGLNVDEWTEGVDYRKLPGKTAGLMDYVVPVGGALAGGYLGKLWRDRQADKQGIEDDSWTPSLVGAGVGLGAGLLGQHFMTVANRGAAQAAEANQYQTRQDLLHRGAVAYGATPHPSGSGGVAHGRWLSEDDLAEAANQPSVDPYRAPGRDGLYDLGPSTPTSHMRWRPTLPGSQATPEELVRHYTQQATQAGNLGFDDLAAQQSAQARGVQASLDAASAPAPVPAEDLLAKWDRVSRAAQLPGASAARAQSLSDAYARAASRAPAPR